MWLNSIVLLPTGLAKRRECKALSSPSNAAMLVRRATRGWRTSRVGVVHNLSSLRAALQRSYCCCRQLSVSCNSSQLSTPPQSSQSVEVPPVEIDFDLRSYPFRSSRMRSTPRIPERKQ